MRTAYILLRADPHYRRAAFIDGLRRLGYWVVSWQPKQRLDATDLLVIWNKTSADRETLQRARDIGTPVIVAENGYWGKDGEGRRPYALALDGHCGSGRWYVGDRSRLDALDIAFQPWRKGAISTVLLAEQRGIGSPQMASPFRFGPNTAAALARARLSVRLRAHPGLTPPPTSLEDDLESADAVVVWSSNCATQALIAGLPTFYCAPHIITQGAAVRFSTASQLRYPAYPDREPAFIRMAWAQAFVSEIETGEALHRLLEVHAGRLPACQEGLGL